jgi:hypothetical protein
MKTENADLRSFLSLLSLVSLINLSFGQALRP